jgi:hypothetical protein
LLLCVQDELNTKWQKRLEEAERGWSHERTSIAASWTARLEELEALAVRQQDALREELEERLGAVSARLHDMAVKESGRERLRQELTLQVTTCPTPTHAPGCLVGQLSWSC